MRHTSVSIKDKENKRPSKKHWFYAKSESMQRAWLEANPNSKFAPSFRRWLNNPVVENAVAFPNVITPLKELTPRSMFLLFGLHSGRMHYIDLNEEYMDDIRALYNNELIESASEINKNYHQVSNRGRAHIEALCKEPLPIASIIWRSAREVKNLLNPTKEVK